LDFFLVISAKAGESMSEKRAAEFGGDIKSLNHTTAVPGTGSFAPTFTDPADGEVVGSKERKGYPQDLPQEVSTEEARRILGVTKDTVLKYREGGRLPFRDIAPPGSSRAIYRFPLVSVLKLRTSYTFAEPETAASPKEPLRRRAKGERKYKHLNLGDG
jgi:hypothetical protein